jgi:hypothetical protein
MTFLNVPYAEKDQARALGAKWNPGRKSWYVPAGVALEPFEKWLTKGQGPDSQPKGRIDAYGAKRVVGANYVALEHGCNPFEPCPECGPVLAKSGWAIARAALLEAMGGLRR